MHLRAAVWICCLLPGEGDDGGPSHHLSQISALLSLQAVFGRMAALSSCSSHLSFPRLGSPSQAKGMSHGASSQSSEMGRIHGLLCILVLMGWFLALVDLSGVNEGVGKALCCG